jgi:hypothetical protein
VFLGYLFTRFVLVYALIRTSIPMYVYSITVHLLYGIYITTGDGKKKVPDCYSVEFPNCLPWLTHLRILKRASVALCSYC